MRGTEISASMEETDNIVGNSPLLKRARDVLRRQHYGIRTETACLDWIKHFVLFSRESTRVNGRPRQETVSRRAERDRILENTNLGSLSILGGKSGEVDLCI